MSVAEITFVIFSLIPVCAAVFPSWKLTTNPAIFGQDFQLKCSLNDTSAINDATLKNADIHFLGGNLLTLKDELNKVTQIHRMYTLTTRVKGDDDVNVPFNCRHRDLKYTDLKNITLEAFEYNVGPATKPDEHNTIPDMLFSMEVQNSPSVPKCTVLYGDKNYTALLKVSSGQPTKVYLPLETINTKCPLTLDVTCDLGGATIVQRLQPLHSDCPKPHLEGPKEKDQTIGYIGLGIFSIVTVVFVGGFIVGLLLRRFSY